MFTNLCLFGINNLILIFLLQIWFQNRRQKLKKQQQQMMMTSNSSGVPNDESLMGGGDMNPGGANPLSGDFIVNQSPGRPSNSSFSGSNAGSSPAYMQSPIHNNPPSSSAHNVQFNPMDQCPNFAFNSEPGKTWFASKEMLHNLVVVVQSLSVLSFDNCSIFMVTYALIMIIVFGNLLVYKRQDWNGRINNMTRQCSWWLSSEIRSMFVMFVVQYCCSSHFDIHMLVRDVDTINLF